LDVEHEETVALTTFLVKNGSMLFLRVCTVDAAIEQVGAQVRFLPPYGPEFNPIELAFAKLEAFLRAMPRPSPFSDVILRSRPYEAAGADFNSREGVHHP
jgi:hypothetical protein